VEMHGRFMKSDFLHMFVNICIIIKIETYLYFFKLFHDVAGRWPAGNIVGALYHKL